MNHIKIFSPLNAKLKPICHLLTLLGAHHILHVSRIRVNGVPVSLRTSDSIQNMNDAPKWHLACVVGSRCVLMQWHSEVNTCQCTCVSLDVL